MKQSKMSKVYNSKVFWMILSLLASVALWAYVSNQESTTITKTLTGVQVQFSGENTLRDEHGLAVSNVDNTSVNVTIRGSRRIIGTLDASKVTAVLDVSKITQAGDMSWSYYLRYPSGTDSSSIQIVSKSPETIGFTVSSLATKTIEVRGAFEGSMKDGYSAEEPTFEPTTITVTGSHSAIEEVSYAWVSFTKDDVDATFSVDTGFELRDKNEKEIPSAGMSFSTDTIKATLPVVETRDVPLGVTIIPGGGATEANCTVSIEPETIRLAGDSAVLDSLSKLIVAQVDLTDFASSYEQSFPITIDNRLQNVTGITEATVKITISGLTTKSFSVTNISCSNIAAGSDASVLTRSVTVTLRGTEAVLENVTADKIRVIADLSEYSDATGTVIADAKVYVEGISGVGAIGNNKVSVEIMKG